MATDVSRICNPMAAGGGVTPASSSVTACRCWSTLIAWVGPLTNWIDGWDAARDISLNGFEVWGEFGRISVNVDTVYRSLNPNHESPNIVEQFKRMAAFEAHP